MIFRKFCRIKSAKRIFEDEYVSEGIPFIRGQEISDNSIKTGTTFSCYISSERYEELKAKYGVPKMFDILITAVGTIGNLCFVDFDRPFYFKDGNVIQLTDWDLTVVYPKYIYYFMQSNYFHKILDNKMIGAVQKALTMDMLYDIDIDLPSVPEQKAIVEKLDPIMNKIALNNSICTDLESMAKQIYDYWFVQFDFPDENGNPYKSSGGKMVWNEELNREIPEGWEAKSLSEVCHENRGVSYTAKDLKDNGVHMLTLGCANKDGSFNEIGIQSFDGKYSMDKVLKPFDLIIYNTDMSKDKYIAGRTIVVPDIFEDNKDIISSHHLTTIHFDDDRLKWVFYATSATDWFREYIKGFVTGTNVLGLDYVGVAEFNMVIPEDNCLTDFADILYKIEQQKSNLFKENQQLTKLRDFLLPMLMNGQIKIGA